MNKYKNYMLTCMSCMTSNPIGEMKCKGCGRPLPIVTDEHIALFDSPNFKHAHIKADTYASVGFKRKPRVKDPNAPQFKKFVKNDAPKNLRKMLLATLIVCCVCLLLCFAITSLEYFYNVADFIAMALTALVMFLVKSRACAVILLIYSVLASVYSFFVLRSIACLPMIIAGILSTVTFLLLNKAYKKYKQNPMEVI